MDGQFAKYVDAVFHHMWEEGKKMDDPEVIRAALDGSGLDGARTLARIQDQDVKDKLATDGAEPIGSTPAEFAALIRDELEKWTKVAKAAGIEPH
jgi:2-hydroxychromene-2-carboxylate isomerase